MSYFHDTSEENAYYEALEEQELQDYAWEMVNYKKKKEKEAKDAAEKEEAEALEKEKKERKKIELEAKYPQRNYVYDEIFKIVDEHESLCATLVKNQVEYAAIFEAHSSILLSFQLWDFSDDMFDNYQFKCRLDFFHDYNHILITLDQGFMKSDELMNLLDYKESEKKISFVRSEKDLSKKYHDVIQEINRLLTKASALVSIKEFIGNNDVKKRLIFHFWNNATCIQDEDADFDDNEIMKDDYIPQEYYCGRYLGFINFHLEWIDPTLYREKNALDHEDVHAPTRDAFVKTRDEFPDIFQEYDYEEDEEEVKAAAIKYNKIS